MGDPITDVKFQNFFYSAPQDATYVSNPVKSKGINDILFKKDGAASKNVLDKYLDGASQDAYKAKQQAVTKIVANDLASPKHLDEEQMVQMIMNAAQETGVDPVVIANIAKHESHFDQNVPSRCGSGIMQLTTISIKDMFQRSKIYDKSLLPILKKYKTPEKLVEAMRKDPSLNIKLGAILYKAKLAQAKGDEHKALELYNGSPIKKKYAQAVMNNIDNSRRTIDFNAIT